MLSGWSSVECVEFIQLLLSIWNRRCISNSLYFHKITNVNSSETLDWHLQHISYALILWNEEMANAEICARVCPSWFCGDLLWKTLLWVTMATDWCFACRGADGYHGLHNVVFHSPQSRCGLVLVTVTVNNTNAAVLQGISYSYSFLKRLC